MKKIRYIAVMLFCLSLYSCYEDLGNYDYTEVNEIEISGLKGKYDKVVGDTINIFPVLEMTIDSLYKDDDYMYQWMVIFHTKGTKDKIMLPIADTKNLDNFKLTLEPGTYDLYYQVTDKKTGVTFQTSCTLVMKTSVYEGFLLLSDVDGEGRLDMLSFRDSLFVPLIDVLAEVGADFPKMGKPYQVETYKDRTTSPADYAIYLLSENGSNRIHAETFRYEPTYNIAFQMLGNVPDGFKADRIAGRRENGAVMISEGNVYNYFAANNIWWSSPVNTLDNFNLFKASSHVAVSSGGYAIVFDETSKSFYRLFPQGTICSYLPEGSLFPFVNTGRELLHLEYVYQQSRFFALMRDPATSKTYFGAFDPNGIQDVYVEVADANIHKATHFAVCPEFSQYIFYSYNNKVYQYDIGLKQTFEMLNPGKEITLIKFQGFGSYIRKHYSDWSKLLMVCTYDSAEKSGQMKRYKVPPINEPLEEVEDENFEGFGRIVSIDYRERE